MIDRDTGWASARSGMKLLFLRTDDGGRHWRDVSPITATYNDGDMDDEGGVAFGFLDASAGCVAMPTDAKGGFGLFATHDGGAHWQPARFPDPDLLPEACIQFIDQQRGFIQAGSDMAMGHQLKATYRTTDGGLTWEKMSSDDRSSRQFDSPTLLPRTGGGGDISFRNATDGWFSGSPRGDQKILFYRTQDSGKTWRPQPLRWPAGQQGYAEASAPLFFGREKEEGLLPVEFIQHSPRESYLFVTYLTADGGATWSLQGVHPYDWEHEEEELNFDFSDLLHGVLLDSRHIYRTADSGKTWQEIKSNYPPDISSSDQFDFVTPKIGWALRSNYDKETAYLLQTLDGGATWKTVF